MNFPHKIVFSVSNSEKKWLVKFGPDSLFFEVQFVWSENAETFVQLLLTVWKVIESQRIRYMVRTLTGVPITQAEQQQPYDVHDNLSASQDPFRGWVVQEIPTDTSGTKRTPVLPNIFKLVTFRYEFDYSVFEDDYDEETDKNNNVDDNSADDFGYD